ncbi:FAD-binding oxidoreductase [Ideonella sp. 4Y16]|uniref:NAD(P)/FAD-dependent oxidoreductase n=1 Tax=Ideonella alba TaxID=2824118 RepID=UPI001B366F99|nr:FAD-dependent oxidoreductase [Ideonella alba]MBQ0946049.1 FAD-binding oxidoreductase [Ideonella alba]
MFDIAILGAGIAGASLAWTLSQDGGPPLRIALLEAEDQPGRHSTGRSAAMFMESYGPPQARALTRASRAFYESPPAGFCSVPLLSPRGALYLAGPGQQTLLEETRAALQATGTGVETLDAAAVLARVPVLRPDQVIGGLWEADAMDIDVAALHQGYLAGARRAGVTLHCGFALQAAERVADGWRLHPARGEPLVAARVVNAAGAWADPVAALFGAAPQRIQPCRRAAFTFDAPTGLDTRDWPVLAALDDRGYFKPDAGVLLGSPANADPVAAHDVQPEELDIALGIAWIEEVSTLTIRRPRHTWAGLRSFAPDGELVIGADPAVRGLFWLAGQGGYGIQSAAGAAALAASLVRGAPLPATLAAHGVQPAVMAPR